MKSHARGDIERQVRMMHAVKPPQSRDGVEQHMLKIDRQIQQDHTGRDREPAGDSEGVEETPATGFSRKGYCYRPQRKQQPDEQGIENDNAEIAGPTCLAPNLLLAARRDQLPPRHCRQHRTEGDQPHERFV
jgi:hypothetical protein